MPAGTMSEEKRLFDARPWGKVKELTDVVSYLRLTLSMWSDGAGFDVRHPYRASGGNSPRVLEDLSGRHMWWKQP